MSVIGSSILAGASGAAGGGSVYVDDVFSTFLYKGDAVGGGDTQTINNGIDLAGEGGLVWIKNRSTDGREHILTDTERGATKYISSNQTSGESTGSNHLNLFNNNGFRVGSDSTVNANTDDFVSWTFRKAPGFFDVVTWSGNGVDGQDISHSLGSNPGMVIIKVINTTGGWYVYHRNVGFSSSLLLNSSSTGFGASVTATSSTTMTVSSTVNGSGNTYVAYIFAHDDAQFGIDEDESIIKCGTYSGSSSNVNVDLGFEPQWLLIKSSTHGYNWTLLDNMRGVFSGTVDDYVLNASGANEESAADYVDLTPTGFTAKSNANVNSSGKNYIYMAIRRPNKPPEAGTDVFAMDTLGGTSPTPPAWNSGFPVDWAWWRAASQAYTWSAGTRLLGPKRLHLDTTAGESDDASFRFDYQNGWFNSTSTGTDFYSWMFKRAPGFFDVVTYPGTGSNQSIDHNLEVAPELVICKVRTTGDAWFVYASALGNDKQIRFDAGAAGNATSAVWQQTTPTSTQFFVGTETGVNRSGNSFIAYLFASLDGISKVGTYDGSSSDINVDCGFTNGARFVLIKRTDATGDWCLFDSSRGIVSGNDPVIKLNSSSAQDSGNDLIDPLTSGFTVVGGNSFVNNTNAGAKYLYLAIA
jgi:hypothetical protein